MKGKQEIDWADSLPWGLREVRRPEVSIRDDTIQCCIKDCTRWLRRRHKGRTPEFCPQHDISVSSTPTYIFREKIRNIIVGRDMFHRVSQNKVENWRLGYETSEDAVTWNVFVGLHALRGLKQACEKLSGIPVSGEPELYLWGNRVDSACALWEGLQIAREKLEEGLPIPTEPDIILRIPGELIMLIEAKFGSPNGTMERKTGRFGTVVDYLNRYAPKKDSPDPLNRAWISKQKADKVLEQLCRNVIFSQRLATKSEQSFVINLVRRAAPDDESDFRNHLSGDTVQFRRRTWEDLFALPVVQSERARL